MLNWILIGCLYVLGIGAFRIVGGLGAAGDALRDWGRASVRPREPHPSS
jgi:hypothetical protein